jgi:hypothetical protein
MVGCAHGPAIPWDGLRPLDTHRRRYLANACTTSAPPVMINTA